MKIYKLGGTEITFSCQEWVSWRNRSWGHLFITWQKQKSSSFRKCFVKSLNWMPYYCIFTIKMTNLSVHIKKILGNQGNFTLSKTAIAMILWKVLEGYWGPEERHKNREAEIKKLTTEIDSYSGLPNYTQCLSTKTQHRAPSTVLRISEFAITHKQEDLQHRSQMCIAELSAVGTLRMVSRGQSF